MANRRITEFPAIAANEIVDQDLLTLVHVFEVNPTLRNKKLTFTEFRSYLDQYYASTSGATISGNVTITGNLSVSGTSTFNAITATGTSTFSGIVVQNNATVSGTISGATITGNALQSTTLNAGTVTTTTATGTTALFTSGNYQTLSGATITGNNLSATSGVFTALSGTTITGTTVAAATGSFQTLSTPVLNVSGNLSVASGFTVTGIAQFANGVQVTGTLSGTTITGTTAQFTTVTGVTGVYTTLLSGATITGNTARFSNTTGVSGTFTTRVSGATVTGNTGAFGNISGISGVFTQVLSGAFITGNTGNYTTLTGVSGTFTNLSGATITGTNVSATTVSGVSGVFTSRVSGTTITGTSGLFSVVNGVSGTFTTQLSGSTITGDNANFTSVTGTTGTFTTIVSGLTVTGNTGVFTNLTGIAGVFTTSVSGATVTGNTIQGTSGVFVNLSGTTITGTTVNAATGVFNTLQATNLSFTNTTVSGDLNVLGSGFFASGVRITGTLSGTTITGNIVNAISGVFTTIVSGDTAQFTTGTFTSLTGTTTTGTTANFATGNFTSLTGTTSRGTTANFTTGTFTSLTGTTTTGTTANFTTGTFTSLTGTTTTGSTANFTNGNFISLTGTTATFTTGNFNSITGGIATITSGVFATGNTTNPSISFSGDSDTGIYSRGANSIAITNSGVTRFTITDSGIVRIGPGSTQTIANVPIASNVHFDGLAPTPDPTVSTTNGIAIISRGGTSFGATATEYLTFYSASLDQYAYLAHSAGGGGDGLTLAGCDFITLGALNTTYVRGDTSVEIQTVGTQRLVAKTTELVINDNASDYDFRVEGTTNQNLLCVDALTNTVVINGANGLNYGPLQVDAETDDQAIAIRCHAVGNEGGKLVIASNSAGVEYLRLYSNSAGSSLDARNKLTFTVGDPVGTGSVDRLSIGFSETVINETGANYDFRIEGDTNANLFFVDASTERIGIGTSSPGSALEINAAAATSPFIAKINTAEVARIDSSGRVLVGTSSGYVTSTSATTQPLLQIHSTNTHEAQVSINSWSTGTATGANLSLCRSDSGTVGTHTAVGSTDVLGAIRFSGSDGDQFIEGASIAASADGTWGDNDGPTKLVFSVTADGLPSPTERLRIDSAGQIEAGSLGTAAAPVWSFLADPNTGIYSPGADQVAISTNGTGRLFVDSSGLLGLGTSSPAPAIGNGATLHLYGASTTSELRLQRGNGTDLSLLAGSTAGGAAISLNNKFSISTDSNSTQAFTVDTSGRVGIGVTSPATTLDVNGDVTIADKIIHGGDTNTAIRFPAADTVSVETAGSERARIDSSGRLLVGTSSQSGGSLLQVNDNRIRIATAKTPASATDTGVAGEICWDANYVYVCTATNTWKRTAISTW